MGARSFFAAALAVLPGVASAAVPVSAVAPDPGKLETYKDWTIGCDNRNRCETVSLLPEGGAWPDDPVMIGVVRDAGADAQAQVWVARHRGTAGDVSFWVDGRKIAGTVIAGGEGRVAGPQASALAIALARGGAMEIRSGAKLVGRPSLAGSGAALRYMDARQGRAGTVTALVATGPLGKSAIGPPPAVLMVKRALTPAGRTAPAALWREELASVGALTGCAAAMKDADAPAQHRLSRTETLLLVPCGAGAYNVTSVPLIATGIAGRRSFRFAAFDYQPGWSEHPKHPQLVNVRFTPETSRLDSFAKGRGIGDCGGSEAYVWDGVRFRLVETTAMGECRGAWHWITTWSAQVLE